MFDWILNTVNPKINAWGVYLIFGIFKGVFIRGRRLIEGGVCSKVKKMTNRSPVF